MSRTVMIDLDGTLCDTSHREPVLRERGWDAYHLECDGDACFTDVAYLVDAFANAGWRVVLVSGRSEIARSLTEQWLERFDVWYDELRLRATADRRPNPEFKKEVALATGASLAVDDHPRVRERLAWIGVPVLLVNREVT